MPERVEVEPRRSCAGWVAVPGSKPYRQRYDQHRYVERERRVLVDTTTGENRVSIRWVCEQCGHVYSEERPAGKDDFTNHEELDRVELRVILPRRIPGAVRVVPPPGRKEIE